jgi:hypothetical protein
VETCTYCQTPIPDPARALRVPDGGLIDPSCAAELARAGELPQVDLPVVRGGKVVAYLPASWSDGLDRFVTLPED